MVAIPFPTSSTPGARPGEGLGRLVNVYAFLEGKALRYGPAPGLVPFARIGRAMRGGLLVGSTLYCAVTDRLVAVSAGGAVRVVGQLPGDDPVTMARNNRVPTAQVVIVAQAGVFVTDGQRVSDYPDADVGAPNSVSFLDGYFLFTYGDATIRASQVNDGDINDQSSTKAEARPDGLLRGIVKGQQFVALGSSSIEFNTNVATAPFPLARAEVVDVGLFGPHAVTGFEPGWDGPWYMVAADGTVRRWSGYANETVSTRAVERAIATVRDPADLALSVYVFRGNGVVSLSGPDFTWDFYTAIGEWFERASHDLPRWRARSSVFAFSRWLVGDLRSDALLAVSEDARRENGEPMRCVMEGFLPSFPVGARLDDLRLDLSTGQGREGAAALGEADPQALVSWSLDGGAAWGAPLARSLGRQGDYAASVRVGSLGRARHRGLKLRIEIADPVPFQFRSAEIGRMASRRD